MGRPTDSDRRRATYVVVCFGLLAAFVVPVFPHFVSPNEFSRWATSASIVERRTVEVSWLLPLLGPRLEDLSEMGDRVYSNKAPGGALIATPAYAVARALVGSPTPDNLRFSLFACRLLVGSIPVLLLGILFIAAARWTGAPKERIPIVLFALIFATPLFPYGLLFFSHALAALLLFASWALLYVAPRGERNDRRAIAAGACIGLSVLSEYTTAVPAAILILVLGLSRERRRVPRVIGGGLPFAIALAVYQKIAFGGFFAVSSGQERLAAFRNLATHGFFGIGWPSPRILALELLDPSKGLVVFSPFLLLVPIWLYQTRGHLSRPASVSLVLAPVSLLVLFAGYPNWHGGWTVGVRYLVPVLPLMVFPMFFGKARRSESFLVGASVVAVMATSLVFPFVPPGIRFPWVSFAGPLMFRGLTVPAWTDLVAPRAVGWAVTIAVLGAAVMAATGSSDRRWTARGWIAAGLCAWIVIPVAILRIAPLGPVQRLERAYIEEVYFEQPGAMTRAFPGTELPRGIVRRRTTEEKLPPGRWPFPRRVPSTRKGNG